MGGLARWGRPSPPAKAAAPAQRSRQSPPSARLRTVCTEAEVLYIPDRVLGVPTMLKGTEVPVHSGKVREGGARAVSHRFQIYLVAQNVAAATQR